MENMVHEIYPTKLSLTTCAGKGYVKTQDGFNNYQPSFNSITITIDIDSSDYYKKDVAEGITRIYQQLIEYYR